MWNVLKQNLTYSIRALLKTPGFTLTGVLTLALGIGATTAIFSVVYAVFAPMPYPKPDQLVMVWSQAQGNRNSVALADFVDWKQRSSSFQDLNAWAGASFNVGYQDQFVLSSKSSSARGLRSQAKSARARTQLLHTVFQATHHEY